MRMRRLACFLIACLLTTAAVGEPFRDSDGHLEVSDCDTGKAWRAAGGQARAGDNVVLLYAAYACARAGEEAEAKALQALADQLPRGDELFGVDGNPIRARIALTLGDVDRASALMRSTSEILLDQWSTIADPMSVMYLAHAMQTLNNQIATTLRDRGDAAGAVTHQLLAARAHDLPDMGLPEMAALYRNVALETALTSADGALLVVACNAILARPGDALTAREAARIAIAINRLAELGRVDDALDLARRLEATGQADAVRSGQALIAFLERQR
jgi:hypothetical protein